MNFQKKEKIHPKKKDFIRVKNDYIYPNGCFMRLVKIKPIKHEKTPPPPRLYSFGQLEWKIASLLNIFM